MNNFYVHLASNTKNDSSTNNTIGNFVTRLSRKINLTEEWEVALTEISYTKSWYNVFEDQNINLVYNAVHKSKKERILKAGNYDIETFIYKINQELKLFKKEDFHPGLIKEAPVDKTADNTADKSAEKSVDLFIPKISYDKHTRRVNIIPGKFKSLNGKNHNIYPLFPQLISDMLGLSYIGDNVFSMSPFKDIDGNPVDVKDIRSDNLIETIGEFNMNAGIHSLYLYCDLIQPVLVGHREVQLLRNVEIPINTKFGDQIDIKYQTPYYYPILRNEFDLIEIDTKDDSNRSIDFAFGRTSLTLHFRKKKQNVNESIYKLLQ